MDNANSRVALQLKKHQMFNKIACPDQISPNKVLSFGGLKVLGLWLSFEFQKNKKQGFE